MNKKETKPETIEEMITRVLKEKDIITKHMLHECCRCEKCTCGKHLCKFSPSKFNLKPTNSEYTDQYTPKKGGNNCRSGSLNKLQIPSSEYHPNQFITKSEYRQKYIKKKSKNEKVLKGEPKQDNIKMDGPTFLNTTYQNSYLPFSEKPEEKIKNIENLGVGGAKMVGTTVYRDNYKWKNEKKNKKQIPIKPENNLLVNNNAITFNGKSIYQADYNKQQVYQNQKDNFAPHEVYRPTSGLRPQSSYRCDYTLKKSQPCPALKCPPQKPIY